MLDLSKPLGTIENLVFYGDHEQPGLVYYLPDRLRLARLPEAGVAEPYELQLQIFREDEVVEGGLDQLEATSGSILSLGVTCTVDEERLERARVALAAQLRIDEPKELNLMLPPWRDGRCDLIVLDATTQDPETIGQESFVEAILGSKKPSLNTGDLKSIFNVRLDRRGTALVAAALQGDQAAVAGVLYDLQFAALRPALDLRIRANLSRCQTRVGHIFSAQVGYPPYVGVGAQLEFIKSKLIEEGFIEVEVLSQAADEETKRLIRETVDEFTDKVMEKLFQPAILPNDLLREVFRQFGQSMPQGGNIVQLGYRFSHEQNFHDRVLEVDYRERGVEMRTHNPQSHLWVLGSEIGPDLDRYVQSVSFGDLWRENTVNIELLHRFEEADDLLSAEVLVWRRRDGYKTEGVPAGSFALPDDALPLGSVTFTRQKTDVRQLSWITDAGEPAGYYYQVRLTYDSARPDIATPAEVVTPVQGSSSRDLIVIPQALAPCRAIEVRIGHLDLSRYAAVDVQLSARDERNQLLAGEIMTLTPARPADRWMVRRPAGERVFLEEGRQYHFLDQRPSLKTQPRAVVDDEIILNEPFILHTINIIPVIAGATPDRIREVLLTLNYQPAGNGFSLRRLERAQSPAFRMEEIVFHTFGADEPVRWEATAVTPDGDLLPAGEGETQGGALIINLREKDHRELLIHWAGPPPVAEGLSYLRLEFRLIQSDGTEGELPAVEFSGEEVDSPVRMVFPRTGDLEMREVRRYRSGHRRRGDFGPVREKEIVVRP